MHCLLCILIKLIGGSSISRHVPSKLLMISLDGFRWDYLNRAQLELGNFTALIDEGVRAKVSKIKKIVVHYCWEDFLRLNFLRQKIILWHKNILRQNNFFYTNNVFTSKTF